MRYSRERSNCRGPAKNNIWRKKKKFNAILNQAKYIGFLTNFCCFMKLRRVVMIRWRDLITVVFMFRFLDDDSDMYNTPYTYNAGRTGSLLAMSMFALQSLEELSHSECMSSVYTGGGCFSPLFSQSTHDKGIGLFSWK